MKFIFNKITHKVTLLIIITNILFATLIVFISSGHLIDAYEQEVNLKIAEKIESERLEFESNILKVESTVDALRISVSERFKEKRSMDDLELQIHSLFREYLLSEEAVSYSLYVYFDPEIDNATHDVWLTYEDNIITRNDEIPMERYISRENMAWFYDVKTNLESHWIPPYRNRYNQYVSSYVIPLIAEDNFIGIIGMYLDVEKIKTLLSPLNTDDQAYYWVLNEYNEIVYHPSLEEGTNLYDTDLSLKPNYDEIYYLDQVNTEDYRHYVSSTHNGWQFIYTTNENLIKEERVLLISKFIISATTFLILIQLIVFSLSRRYKKVLAEIMHVLKLARQGDYSTKIQINSSDELGQFSSEINETHDRIHKLQTSLETIAYFTKSTALPNWDKLINDLKYMIGEKDVVMYLIDLDDLKHINELIGRSRGDQLITSIASRLKEIETDDMMLYHIHGDQFIYIEFVSDYSTLSEHAKMILEIFEQFTYSANYNFSITCSIGIAKYPDDAMETTGLLICAQSALEEAKSAGKGHYKIYSRFLSQHTTDTNELENEFEKAIDNNELVVHYQPKFNQNRLFVGLEAFIRWQHPIKGLLYPSYFLEFAEKSGLISRVGDFVLNSVCETYNQLVKEDIFPKTISINISSRQLLSPLIISSMLGILRDDHIDAEVIELEIKEDMLNYDRKRTLKKLNALHVAGMKITLDNLGNNMVALKNIIELPISKVKIHKELIAHLDDNTTKQLVENIIQVSHNVGLKVTAEGIETEAQFDLLNSLNCDEYQGFYLGEPSDIQTIIQILKKQTQ